MKLTLGFILLLISFAASTFEIKVNRMSRDGDLERSFVLSTQLKEKVVLDCQSFIQGLRVGEYQEAVTFLLDPEQCESLQGRVRGSLRKSKKHCIVVESDVEDDYTCN